MVSPAKSKLATRGSGTVYVAAQRRKYIAKDGVERIYESFLLRRSFRDNGIVRNETIANLSALPTEAIAAVKAVLAGQSLVAADTVASVVRSRPHGHLAAMSVMAKQLGMPDLLGSACRSRQVAMALILARAVAPTSKLATTTWWSDTTVGPDFEVDGIHTDEVYAAMYWLLARQARIEKRLAKQHLDPTVNPSRIAMFDLSSSWVTGRHSELAAHGSSRDGKNDCEQIEYGLLTDLAGRPVAIRVIPGDPADPTAFTAAASTVKDTFKLTDIALVGDRGMITTARIEALREVGGIGWLTALRAPQIAALAADDGPLQMSMFDTGNYAEFSHPDYPGERLIACRNPAVALERSRKRTELLAATESLLAAIAARVAAGRLRGAGPIGEAVGKAIGKYKMGKHFYRTITDTNFTYGRDQTSIDADAALDGICLLRTTIAADTHDTAAVVSAYKNLARVERGFRSLESIDMDLRPCDHQLSCRVRAHVLICMLAGYLNWHLRHALKPLTFADENCTTPTDPAAPAQRSARPAHNATDKTTTDDHARSYQSLLGHLSTLARNDIRYGANGPAIATLTTPTTLQQQIFDHLGATIPLTLT